MNKRGILSFHNTRIALKARMVIIDVYFLFDNVAISDYVVFPENVYETFGGDTK